MRFILPALALLILSAPAYAWNVATHEVVAAVAYDVLAKEHPDKLAKIVAILKQHPLHEFEAKRIDALNAPADQRDKAMFLSAARFPDDVRMAAGIHGYSHPTWHYINLPLSAKGDPTTGPQPDQPNAVSALKGQATVLSGDNPAADKAVAICWIAHLVGDLHQPLHAVAMYSSAQPKGDRGGNDTWVRFGTGKGVNLHSVWDGLLGKDIRFAAASGLAAELVRRPDLKREALAKDVADLDPESWAVTSADLAYKSAYRGGTLHGGDKDHPATLPADYGAAAKAIAERQVVLAGYRLAAMLGREVK